jgi:serine/threonine protein phosphatase PrpC
VVKQIEPTGNGVMLSVSGHTDVGMHRSGNEDAFLVADLTTGVVGLSPDVQTHQIGSRGTLLVVSDGMGGAVAGEIASELAVETLKESLMEMPGDFNAPDKLKMAAEIANERIWSHARQNPELTGMGATLTAVLVHSTVAYIAQVGDSRAYLIRGNKIKQVTEDQSLVEMLIKSGAITREQAHSVPQNVIMQALGTQPTVKVVMSAVQLCRNDHLLLCSDGLSGKIPEAQEIAARINEYDDLSGLCRSLIETANERGGEDNITVVVARFDGEALHSANDNTSITGSFLPVTTEDTTRPNAVTKPLESATPTSASSYATTDPLEQPVGVQEDDFDEPGVTEYLSADVLIPGFSQSKSLVEPAAPASDEEPTMRQESVPFQAEIPQELPTQPMMPPQPMAMPPQLATRKQSYAGIIIIGLISILMIAAATYFYFVYYLNRRQPEPPQDNPNIEQPANQDQKPQTDESNSGTSEEKKPEAPPQPQGEGQAKPESSNPSSPNN